MNSSIVIALDVNAQVSERLDRLRIEFAHACNFIAPVAQKNHCWNRVALHHLTYHDLRKAFPDLGSQMACNAIYSVCRSYRLLLDHPQSPFFAKKIAEGHLPHIQFLEHSPVFFDRHTLSLQKNVLSLFTLEGRLRFGIGLSETDEQTFRTQKLREIQLTRIGNQYLMTMLFSHEQSIGELVESLEPWPDYFVLKDLADGFSDTKGEPANAVNSLQRAS
jgi:hypothetical protein